MTLRSPIQWLRLPRLQCARPPSYCVATRLRFLTTHSALRARHRKAEKTAAPPPDEEEDHHLAQDDLENEPIEGFDEDDPNSSLSDQGPLSDRSKRGPYWIEPSILRAAKKELPWLKADAASLSRRVQEALRAREEELATAIVRLASREPNEAVVAWNILIKHAFAGQGSGGHQKALRLFNEMKKRHQTPDATTYGTLLSGLAKQPRPEGIVGEAFNLFQLMQRETSTVKPSVRHYNMLITICGRANDMERFWTIVQALPESGPDAANAETYISMLEALRHVQLDTMTADYKYSGDAELVYPLMRSAMAIWGAAVSAWSKGTLEMTPDLVASMGRFLTSSPHLEYYPLMYALIEQTVGIPAYNRHRGIKSGARESVQHYFAPVTDSPYAVRVQPTNAILTTILECAQLLNLKRAAQYYWFAITESAGYGLDPDVPSLKQYLRVLRAAKSSREAVVAMLAWRNPAGLDDGAYRLAMSACRRNAWRPGTLTQATELYGFRKMHMFQPKMAIMEQFVQIMDISLLDEDSTHWMRLEALTVLGDDVDAFVNWQDYGTNYGWGAEPSGTGSQDFAGRSVDIAKMIIGLLDHMANEGFNIDRFAPMRSKLSEFVRRQHFEAGLPRTEPSVLDRYAVRRDPKGKRRGVPLVENWKTPGRHIGMPHYRVHAS